MHFCDESTPSQKIWSVQINWSRELTFSARQRRFINRSVHKARGVYCIYAKCCSFDYRLPSWATKRWSPVVYIGSGWLNERLYAHLSQKKNEVLTEHLAEHQLAFRFDRIFDDDEDLDWPKTVEACMLRMFKKRFGDLPPANQRAESIPLLHLDKFFLNQSNNFNFLKRG